MLSLTQPIADPDSEKTRTKAAEVAGMSPSQYRKASVAKTEVEPVKEAWEAGELSTHAAYDLAKAPDEVKESIQQGVMSLSDGLKAVRTKTAPKAPPKGSPVQAAKARHEGLKEALGFDGTHRILKLLETLVVF